MEYTAKNMLLGRRPAKDKNQAHPIALVKLFLTDHPLRGMQFPDHDLAFENIEYVKIQTTDFEYYLEGNDLVFREIHSVSIEQKDTILYISVKRQ